MKQEIANKMLLEQNESYRKHAVAMENDISELRSEVESLKKVFAESEFLLSSRHWPVLNRLRDEVRRHREEYYKK